MTWRWDEMIRLELIGSATGFYLVFFAQVSCGRGESDVARVHPDFASHFLKKGEALMSLSPELRDGGRTSSLGPSSDAQRPLCFSLTSSRLDIIWSGGLRRWGGVGKLYGRLRREGSSFSRSRKRASEGSCRQSALSSCFDTGPNANHVSSHPLSCCCPPLALALWTDPFHCAAFSFSKPQMSLSVGLLA
ncbi:hypothetical protein ROHU_031185 [Labeo rohita]|uniref:Uncharacterized protein n=1 Tax=Labeo rohita TaxID=84645 RepID=A0A498LWQ5_LABRO|nr:hypothetical protein ROHU_031185 [Labeo rohita]